MANLSHINSSTSFLKDVNLKVNAVHATAGSSSYAISGILSTDVIVFATGWRPSTATYKSITAFAATAANTSKTGSVAISGDDVLSGGIVLVGWFDVSE